MMTAESELYCVEVIMEPVEVWGGGGSNQAPVADGPLAIEYVNSFSAAFSSVLFFIQSFLKAALNIGYNQEYSSLSYWLPNKRRIPKSRNN